MGSVVAHSLLLCTRCLRLKTNTSVDVIALPVRTFSRRARVAHMHGRVVWLWGIRLVIRPINMEYFL